MSAAEPSAKILSTFTGRHKVKTSFTGDIQPARTERERFEQAFRQCLKTPRRPR